MEEVALSETESRYFSDLFLCCDVDKTGKIPMLKAMELYRSANLSNDVIREITSLTGIPHTALHISRAQFYACLKLIAAYQASLPLRQELVSASVQLPLPRFSWKESPSGIDMMSTSGTSLSQALHGHSNGLNSLPPPVADRRNSLPRRADWQETVSHSAAGSRRSSAVSAAAVAHQQQNAQNSDVQSTDSEVEQNESSGGGGVGGCAGSSSREARRRGGSPEAWSTNSDSPTPTNSVAERPWAKETLWHGLLGDEHRQLLGTEEESSDRHSSDDEHETDLETVYQITPEQREYYFKQFKAVQHDPNGLLSGHVARVFFEKSRIPVEELRHIWQLCDVTRDGALSLAEFTAAMHLVVLRRNNISLPAVLPACLHPNVLQHSTLASQMPTHEPPEADLLHLNDDDDDDNTDNTIITASLAMTTSGTRADKNIMNLSTLSTTSQVSTNSRQGLTNLTPPTLPPPVKNRSISNSPNVEPSVTPPSLPANAAVLVKPKERQIWVGDAPPTQWTKFTESPTSNVSSPGPKPVNFDMQRTAQAVVSDPQILHPVPLRVTPVAGTLANNEIVSAECESSSSSVRKSDGVVVMRDATRDSSPKQHNISNNSATASNATIHHRDSLQNNDLRAIQRPQAKKLPVKNIGALPPPPQRESSIGSVGCTASTTGAGDELTTTSAATAMPINISTGLSGNHQLAAINKKDPPPLPPPRPHRHGRSSSLDLNKFKISAPAGQQPEIMAQASFDLQTTTGFADFTQFPDDGSASIQEHALEQQLYSLPPQQTTGVAPPPIPAAVAALPPSRFSLQSSNQRVSAFEVYRKPATPRNSQSPTTSTTTTTAINDPLNAAQQPISKIPTHPPPTAPAPIATNAQLPNADLYEKRVSAISETLKHVSFKHENNTCEILRHLREQNNLLLRICNDLSDELLTVQTRKEEMRLKLEAIAANDVAKATAAAALSVTRTGSSFSAPVTANVTGGSGSSGVHSNV